MASKAGTSVDSVSHVCRSGSFSETVIDAVAEAKDVDPLDLEPLYSTIDPDALDGLFRPTAGSTDSTMELRFSMAGCQVVIHGDGEVVVTPATENAGRQEPLARNER